MPSTTELVCFCCLLKCFRNLFSKLLEQSDLGQHCLPLYLHQSMTVAQKIQRTSKADVIFKCIFAGVFGLISNHSLYFEAEHYRSIIVQLLIGCPRRPIIVQLLIGCPRRPIIVQLFIDCPRRPIIVQLLIGCPRRPIIVQLFYRRSKTPYYCSTIYRLSKTPYHCSTIL